jgi:hypothetical protein
VALKAYMRQLMQQSPADGLLLNVLLLRRRQPHCG